MPSLVIRRFNYSADEQTLRIWFVSGSVYDYFDVPPDVHRAFKAAFSKGSFFADRIRPVYRYKRVSDAAYERPSPSP